MKPLTDNMLEALQIIAAWERLGRTKIGAMNAVNENSWTALYKRGLFNEAEDGTVVSRDYLSSRAVPFIDKEKVMEHVRREQRRLENRAASLQEQMDQVRALQVAAHEATINSGMVEVSARVWFGGNERGLKATVLVAQDSTPEHVEARLEECARARDWTGCFGPVAKVQLDYEVTFGPVRG